MESSTPAKEFFNQAADSFRSHYGVKPSFRDRLRIFMEAVTAHVAPGGSILDYGCGPGVISLELAKRGYSVTGLDIAPAMVSIAREAAEKFGYPNAVFNTVRGNTIDDLLDHGPAGFDAVVCSSVIEYVDDEEEFLTMLTRVLKDSGFLFISIPQMNSVGGFLHRIRLRLLGLIPGTSREVWGRRAQRMYRWREFVQRLEAKGYQYVNRKTFELPGLGGAGVRLSHLSWMGAMTLLAFKKKGSTA